MSAPLSHRPSGRTRITENDAVRAPSPQAAGLEPAAPAPRDVFANSHGGSRRPAHTRSPALGEPRPCAAPKHTLGFRQPPDAHVRVVARQVDVRSPSPSLRVCDCLTCGSELQSAGHTQPLPNRMFGTQRGSRGDSCVIDDRRSCPVQLTSRRTRRIVELRAAPRQGESIEWSGLAYSL